MDYQGFDTDVESTDESGSEYRPSLGDDPENTLEVSDVAAEESSEDSIVEEAEDDDVGFSGFETAEEEALVDDPFPVSGMESTMSRPTTPTRRRRGRPRLVGARMTPQPQRSSTSRRRTGPPSGRSRRGRRGLHDAPASAAAEEDPSVAPPPRRVGRGRGRGRPRVIPAANLLTMDWQDGLFAPTLTDFDDTDSGFTPHFELSEDAFELEYFLQFINNDIADIVVNETNRYYHLHNDVTSSKMKQWQNLDHASFYVFLALTMLMGHVRKADIREYWSTDLLQETPVFGKYMTRDRYRQILRYLHFADNQRPNKLDRLWKARDILDLIVTKVKSLFKPFRNLCIDESLILFRGRVVFRQYIPSKRHRYGIKLFVIADCDTGIVLDIVVYTATDLEVTTEDPHGFSGSVVKRLIEPYLDKRHRLFTDNYYTSPALAHFLLERQTDMCGTVRSNRKLWPKFGPVEKKAALQKHTDEMVAIRFNDNKYVDILSTFHTGVMVRTEKVDYKTGLRIYKPDAVVDYNLNMRMVDKSDMQVATVDCLRKCAKWYKKFFFHLLDVCLLNSYNMWLAKTGNKSSLRKFGLKVIQQMLDRFSPVQLRGAPSVHHISSGNLSEETLRWISIHHLVKVPQTTTSKRVNQKKCAKCHKDGLRRDVTTYCPGCNKGLCLNCFVPYHAM